MIRETYIPAIIKITFAFILGITLGNFIPFNFWILRLSTIIILPSFLIIIIYNKRNINMPTNIFILLSFLFLGFLNIQLKNPFNNTLHINKKKNKIIAYKGVIIQEVKESKNSKYAVLKIQKIKVISKIKSKNSQKGEWEKAIGKIKIILRNQQNHINSLGIKNTKIKYGDLIIIKGTPKKIDSNSGSVTSKSNNSYNKYLLRNNISHKHYIQHYQIQLIKNNSINNIYTYAQKLRNKFVNILKKYIKDQKTFSIVTAMALGNKQYLDPETKLSYKNTGIMHILAVSGLHIGIIFWILNLFLISLTKKKFTRWFYSITIFVSIWLYAFITGLSESIVRAAIMFSIYLISQNRNHTYNPYPSMFFSALIILILKPSSINSMGFLLSYLAVFGIIYLHPKIFSLLNINNKLLRYIWKMSSISISAQIATAPIIVYTFKSLPLYFIISNWIMIPLAFIILFLTMVIIVISFAPYLAQIIGIVLTKLILFSNSILHYIQNLPFNTINFNQISVVEIIFIYGIIASLILTFVERRFMYIILLSLFSFLNCTYKIKKIYNRNLIYVINNGQ